LKIISLPLQKVRSPLFFFRSVQRLYENNILDEQLLIEIKVYGAPTIEEIVTYNKLSK